jgi:transposase InsO family protein
VKFRFIEEQKVAFPIAVLCATLDVSRAGYYAWRTRPLSERAANDTTLVAEIREIHAEHERRCGSPRVHKELLARGHKVGRRRVARLMHEHEIFARRRRRFRVTTESKHTMPVAPNLLAREFQTDAPNKVWVTDITYVWTREGWLYLAAILDLYSRAVVGWAMSESLSRELALRALDMAVRNRRPLPGLVHHSDRGSQYASGDYQDALKAHGMTCSMSRKGDCWDNAVAESFFATLKTELVHERNFMTRAEARSAIFDFIERYYNRRRRHSSLGYVSPVEYEIRNYVDRIAA